ncbi:MAG: protein kinase [Gemmatimonas sp.]
MSLREQLQRTLGAAYTIENELGGGGMSRVFVATETALRRRVVVKVLPGEMSGPLAIERFKREISIAARLQHAHMVPLLTAGEVDGLPYFTMPFVEGQSLRVRLAQPHAPLLITDTVRILREIASALAYAHAHDVVHRDIKPDNVLLSGGAAMVTDFGVAKAVDAAVTNAAEGLTSVGLALGTPAYMSPEQATADPLTDHRADIYAWGMLAYEMLAGSPPFAGRSAQAMLAAQVTEVPADLASRGTNIPPALSALVMRAIAKSPDDRPQRADDLVRALDTIDVSSGALSPSRTNAAGSSKNTRLVAAVGAAVVLLVVSVLWFKSRDGSGNAVVPPIAQDIAIAVLPIEIIGGDTTTEYLADGLTSELARALKQVPGVQVAGELSTSRFKGTHEPPGEIARQLHVTRLLSGKLRPETGRVRLQIQLTDTSGIALWSGTYDTEIKDNFAMQDSITGKVAGALKIVLSPATLVGTRAGRTINPDAHLLYMRGMFEKNKVSAVGLRNALEYFKQALALDPNYAQAHAGMAFAYDLLADAFEPSHEYHLLSLAAARRAVAIDSLLPEARTLLGYEIAAATWDFTKGKIEIDRGLELDPKNPDALFMAGLFCWMTGDHQHGLDLVDRLITVDPLSPLAARLRAELLASAERYEEALEQDKRARALDPMVEIVESTRGNALRELKRYDEAVEEFAAKGKLLEQPMVGLAVTYAKMGKRTEALQVIHAVEAREKQQWVDPEFIASMYAALGDKNSALRWLEKGISEKTFSSRAFMSWNHPWFRPLWDDAQYQALRTKVMATTFND